jgi:hypothetical protein
MTNETHVPEKPGPQADEQPSIFDEGIDLSAYEKPLRNARIWLYVIAGLQFLMGIYEYFANDGSTIGIIAFGIDAAVAGLFLALGLWSRQKPAAAFTSALVCFVIVFVGFGLLDNENFFRGVLFKVLVVVALVRATRNARQYEALKERD